jgi:hypothetical protein
MSQHLKPSVVAISSDCETHHINAATKLFGMVQSLDAARFEQMVFSDRLEHCKHSLCAVNPDHVLEIGACATVDDLRALLERPEIAATHSALVLAAEGGRFRRIDNVTVTSGGMSIDWSAAGTGFGQMHFYVSKADGKLHVDSECMGRHFVRSVLLRLADEVIIDGE